MQSEIELARQTLNLAKETSNRLWEEYSAFARKQPRQPVMDPEQKRLLMEASESTGEVYAAEHALFAAEHGTPGIVGREGEFQWLSLYERNITDLLRLCPDVVLNKYIAVTGIDGGTLKLTEQEKREGWWTHEDAKVFTTFFGADRDYRDGGLVAYSPRIGSVHGLPNESHDECCEGHDEWYVFAEEAPVREMEVFINWGGFRLYDPSFKWWYDHLFEQMANLGAQSYISDGTVFTFATRDTDLFATVIAAFSATSD